MRIAVGRGLLFGSKRRPRGSVDGSGSGRAPSLAGPSLSRRIFGPEADGEEISTGKGELR